MITPWIPRAQDGGQARRRHPWFTQPEMFEFVAKVLRPRDSAREKIRPVVMDGPPAVAGRIVRQERERPVLHRIARATRTHERGHERVLPVAQFFRERPDELPRVGRDARMIAQRERHGRTMHAGTVGDILERHMGHASDW